MSDVRMTPHARERCEQMGVSTKVAKRIWRERSMTRPEFQRHENRVFVHSSTYRPDLVLIVEDPDSDDPRVITVMYHSYERVERPEASSAVLK